jgi:glycosyltransferase involved in cell wall biosynthesis
MASMVDGSRISVVPTGVDLATFVYDPEARPAEPRVVFTGSMDWKPNIDGVEYFCREIWPLVLAEVPRARFQIVGRDPHPRVRQLASASVEITGTVPSIVDYLRQASVVVIPLRIGGGTRIKIYEGMAMGKATVSTSVGAEGLDVHDGHDIILADEAGAFAAGIIRLLQQESTRRQFEAAAAATAGRYDWSVISEGFAGVLQHTIRETRR